MREQGIPAMQIANVFSSASKKLIYNCHERFSIDVQSR